MKNKRGNVAVIALIVVIVAITTGVITWLVTTKTQAPVQQAVVTQPAPVTTTQPVPESAKPAFDKTALQNTVFSTVDTTLKAKYSATTDPGYAKWGNKVDITSVDVSLKAAKGKWYDTVMGDWDWIAWQQDDAAWKILLSFDGFSCAELKSVPSQYDKFFQDVVYFRDTKTFEYKKQNCY